MSKANWAVVSPSSGSGNATVNVSSSEVHTGRTARSTVLTITAANVDAKTVTINQSGKPAYVDVADSATAVKTGQNVTISGKANSSTLIFSLGTGSLDVSLPATYTAAGVSTDNGAAISGDPGVSAEYNFSIVLTVAANETVEELTRQIIVTDENGNSDTCLLTQSAGEATLSVSKSTIDLTYHGTAVSFDVYSNTSWTIS